MARGFSCVEEDDIELKPEKFDPKKTWVTLTFKPAEAELQSWVASESSRSSWVKDEKLFREV